MFDDMKNITSYSDINLLLAIQLLLPSSDSKDFVDRPTKRKLADILKDFEKIESKLGVQEAVMEALKNKNSLTTNVLRYGNDLKDDKRSKKRVNTFISNKTNEKNKGDGMMLDLLSSDNLITNYFKDDDKDEIMLGIDKSEKIHLLINFVENNFHPVGYDIKAHEPEDFTENPAFISELNDPNLIEMSVALQNTWKELSRISNPIPDEGSTTLMDLPRPFIVPGGRFREFYYWDTYWILEGLLVSDMHKSAENIIVNFISIIEKYGYIPNGTRKYYLYRSQPPFFAMMLLKLLDIENGRFNKLVLGEGLDAALKEHEFWKTYKSIKVTKDGKEYELNQFRVHANFPRPESFAEDVITYEKQSGRTEEEMYSSLKSGAESGWDFSSRWLDISTDIGTIRTEKQIPVDLNAILFRNEVIISTLLDRKGDKTNSEKFLKFSEEREAAINAILWNTKEGVWMDYLYEKNKFIDPRFYFSNITPMIYGVQVPEESNIYEILQKYSLELFGYKGGIPVSGKGLPTVQQWDFPNVWAPHQHMMVDFLLGVKEEELALHVAKSFFNSVYEGFKKSKTFFEKYNCINLGKTGGGGEYTPQTGFGWTNGAVLGFILKFKDKLMEDYDFDSKLAAIVKELKIKIKNPPSTGLPKSFIPLVSNVTINIKT